MAAQRQESAAQQDLQETPPGGMAGLVWRVLVIMGFWKENRDHTELGSPRSEYQDLGGSTLGLAIRSCALASV